MGRSKRSQDTMPRIDENEQDLQKIVFNRAFLFAVRHNPTGLLLTIGRYIHPWWVVLLLIFFSIIISLVFEKVVSYS